MLVLTRKLMEKLFIGDDICVTVVRLEGGAGQAGYRGPAGSPHRPRRARPRAPGGAGQGRSGRAARADPAAEHAPPSRTPRLGGVVKRTGVARILGQAGPVRERTRRTWVGFHGRSRLVRCPSALSRAAIAGNVRPSERHRLMSSARPT